jgi:CubicO group peptidase (beta-lactamase class C family)
MKASKTALLAILLWMGACSKQSVSTIKDLELDHMILQVMDQFKIPGLALGVIKDGEIYISKGYGLRDIDANLTVNADTTFQIGSTTKAFTTAGLGILRDRDLVDFDQPMKEYQPDFKLYDEEATALATPTDLMVHRTGVPRHDFVWAANLRQSREEYYELLRYLEPSAKFREKWQYNNFMYMTLGVLTERISGESWEDFVQGEILTPLDMHRTSFTKDTIDNDPNGAKGYIVEEGKLTGYPTMDIDAMAPAGAINSSARDMLRWVDMHLENGIGILSQETHKELITPKIEFASSTHENLSKQFYADGWMTRTYRGHQVIYHGGDTATFAAFVSFIPDLNTGMVILMNARHPLDPQSLSLMIYDQVLDNPYTDWITIANKPIEEEEKEVPTKVEPPLPLSSFEGRFRHGAYGTLSFTVEVNEAGEDQLMLVYEETGPEKIPLIHVVDSQGNEYFTVEGSYANKIGYKVSKDGKVSTMTFLLEPDAGPTPFEGLPQQAER